MSNDYFFSLDDAWLISVRNYIREYFAAANSIFLLPAPQQESAVEFTERIDLYIREKLFPMLQRIATEKGVDAVSTGHSLAYRGKYFYCDYAYFKKYSFEENFVNMSLITTIPAEAVIPTLVRAAKSLEDLTHCIPQDVVFQGLTNYRHVEELMSLICESKIDVSKDDWENREFSCSIDTKDCPHLYEVVAKLIAENYHFNDICDKPSGISTGVGGTILQPVINIYLTPQLVLSECEYGIKLNSGKCFAFVPYKGDIIFGMYRFEFPTPTAISEEFNDKYNRVVYPEYKGNITN